MSATATAIVEAALPTYSTFTNIYTEDQRQHTLVFKFHIVIKIFQKEGYTINTPILSSIYVIFNINSGSL